MGFKFLGKIGAREVIVMIGTASTHNFISRQVVVELQIPIERTLSYRVSFGFGPDATEGAEVCNNVVIKTHGIQIIQRFFPTELGIADVLLGSEWLRCLGSYSIRGGPRMAMTLNWLGRRVTLRSDPSLTTRLEIGLATLQWDEPCDKNDDDEPYNDDDDDEPCNKEDDDEPCNKDGDDEPCKKKEKEE